MKKGINCGFADERYFTACSNVMWLHNVINQKKMDAKENRQRFENVMSNFLLAVASLTC